MKLIKIVFLASVYCGNQAPQAETCADCPQGNGASWCQGECVWFNGQCHPNYGL